jgi:hypothetical protein
MPNELPRKPEAVEWQRTSLVEKRLLASSEFTPPRPGDAWAPHGYFASRRIIGSEMGHVNGGVYLGAHAREALVVDDEPTNEAGNKLRAFYTEKIRPAIEQAAAQVGRKPKDVALSVIYRTVLKAMPYDAEKTDLLIHMLTGGQRDMKIHLAPFIQNGVGVCRHQALLVAYLIEKLTQEDDLRFRLNGKLSLERNSIANLDENKTGAHAWVRYTSTSGEVYIVDVAQKKCGKLDDLAREPGNWEYARPEDWKRIRQNAGT